MPDGDRADEAAPARPSALTTVVGALGGLGRDLDGVAVAELLWLAARRPPAPPAAPPDPDRAAAGAPAPGADEPAGRERPAARRLFPAVAEPGGPRVPARRLQVPAGSALPRSRRIATALRPLGRPWRDGRELRLDIGTTIADYARGGELVPAFRPAPERWFDLTVALDRSPTMRVWDETIGELLSVLARTGVFRTLRVQRTDTVEPAGAGAPHRPRRLTLVVSDCVPGDGGLWPRVHRWATAGPTVLLNPLPPGIWRHCGLDLPAVRVAPPPGPGARNGRLPFATPPLLEPEPSGPGSRWLPVPVIGLSPRSVERWARTLMRGDPAGCQAVLVPRAGTAVRPAQPPPAVTDAAGLIESFLHRASPAALRLAVLCSLYPRLTTGLLHLVRQELVPDATAADAATVVVGGLLEITGAGPADSGGPVLEFRPGVRELLAHRLGVRDARRTHDAVSRFIAERAPGPAGLPALVPDERGESAVAPGIAPFASASAETLRRLGMPVAEPAPPPAAAAGRAPLPEPVPATVRDTGPERPYFFLSYARTPAPGAGGPDPNLWVERLFMDLCAHVAAVADLPDGMRPGVMERGPEPGADRAEPPAEALARCRVLVPLYSPRYFASELCGREWAAFARRTARKGTRSSRGSEAIVPALWVPVPSGRLPAAAERLGFDHRAIGDRYAADGLYGLVTRRAFLEQYEAAVHRLALRIVSVAGSVEVAPVGPAGDGRVPNAFAEPPGGARPVRITVVAPSVWNLPEGRDGRHYGPHAHDWNPFFPESGRPLVETARELIGSLGREVSVEPFDEHAPPFPGPEILLIDTWALEDGPLRDRLASYDALPRAGTLPLLVWSGTGAPRPSRSELYRRLMSAMPRLMETVTAESDALSALGAATFRALLPEAVRAAEQRYGRAAGPP
ncbi:TIR-like protein FxsC [Streptomyces sp. NPDC001889]